jgi:hypothetical protein
MSTEKGKLYQIPECSIYDRVGMMFAHPSASETTPEYAFTD